MSARRCQALDDNGAPCRKVAKHTQDIHGEAEFRDIQWSWVRVHLCVVHCLQPKPRRTRP